MLTRHHRRNNRAQEKDIVLRKRKGSVIAYLLGNLNERFLQKKLEKKGKIKCFSHVHEPLKKLSIKYFLFG